MFSRTEKPRTRGADATPSIIAADLSIRGDLASDGELLIEGRIDGDVNARKVTVGPDASIEGDVLAEELVVHGTIKGRVRCDSATLKSTAHIEGDVYHRTLTVDAGATVDGIYRHMEKPREQELPAKGGAPLALAAPLRKPAANPPSL